MSNNDANIWGVLKRIFNFSFSRNRFRSEMFFSFFLIFIKEKPEIRRDIFEFKSYALRTTRVRVREELANQMFVKLEKFSNH